MPGYQTRDDAQQVRGVEALTIRALQDHRQFSDPFGLAAALGISSATWPLFGMAWPSGLQLAALLAARPVQPAERILEIGCGLALASIVGHRRGADITASDHHPLAGEFLATNLALNELAPMKYRHGHWSANAAQSRQALAAGLLTLRGSFDLVIGSDLLYERDERGQLARFIGRHAAAGAEVWIVDPDRGNRSAFNRHMAAGGFALEEQRLDRKAGAPGGAYKGRLLRYARAGLPGLGTATAS